MKSASNHGLEPWPAITVEVVLDNYVDQAITLGRGMRLGFFVGFEAAFRAHLHSYVAILVRANQSFGSYVVDCSSSGVTREAWTW